MRFATLIIAALPLLAQENGIYAPSENDSDRLVNTQDGVQVRLGTRRAFPIRNCTVVSQNNENTLFFVSIQVPYDPALLGGIWHTLIVDGTAYRQRGGGASEGEYSSLGFNVSDANKASQIAAYLKTSARLRQHPGHHFQVSFTPSKPVFQLGSDVHVKMRLTNTGSQPLAFMANGGTSHSGDPYAFKARYQGRDLEARRRAMCFDCIDHAPILRPGETFEREVSLSEWYSFSQPGTYEIHGSYFLDLRPTVDPFRYTLWEEYISADFQFVVE